MHQRQWAFWAHFVFMFGFTKTVKLMGLFLREPADVVFLPVSIAFGYFHGLIKLYALCTLNMVCRRRRSKARKTRLASFVQSPLTTPVADIVG